jgi:hypothetical protein
LLPNFTLHVLQIWHQMLALVATLLRHKILPVEPGTNSEAF